MLTQDWTSCERPLDSNPFTMSARPAASGLFNSLEHAVDDVLLLGAAAEEAAQLTEHSVQDSHLPSSGGSSSLASRAHRSPLLRQTC